MAGTTTDNLELVVEYLRMCADGDNLPQVADELSGSPDSRELLRTIIENAGRALNESEPPTYEGSLPTVIRSGHYAPEHVPWMRGPG